MENSKGKVRSRIICSDLNDYLDGEGKNSRFKLIIADPPYNIGKNFGNNYDSMQETEYVAWCRQGLKKCLRALDDNGMIYVYGFTEILARVASTFPLNRQRFLIWHYTNKTVPSSLFWQRSHESILCLGKSSRPTLFVDRIREEYTESYKKLNGKQRASSAGRYSRSDSTTNYAVHDRGALPRDVLKVPALAGGAGSKQNYFMCVTCGRALYRSSDRKLHAGHDLIVHPTQKPFELTKRLMLSLIDVPDNGGRHSLFIPFCGSGSECVVAEHLGIKYVATEINKNYVEYARKGVQAYKNSSGSRGLDKAGLKTLSGSNLPHATKIYS